MTRPLTIITVKPHGHRWEVIEMPAQPPFEDLPKALQYALLLARLRLGEIRIFDADGKLQEKIPFDDAGVLAPKHRAHGKD